MAIQPHIFQWRMTGRQTRCHSGGGAPGEWKPQFSRPRSQWIFPRFPRPRHRGNTRKSVLKNLIGQARGADWILPGRPPRFTSIHLRGNRHSSSIAIPSPTCERQRGFTGGFVVNLRRAIFPVLPPSGVGPGPGECWESFARLAGLATSPGTRYLIIRYGSRKLRLLDTEHFCQIHRGGIGEEAFN